MEDNSGVQPDMQAAANEPDPLEPGRCTMEANLCQKITVNRYSGAAGRPIPAPENHGDHGYTMFSSSQPSSDNIYWPFRSRMDWLVARWAKMRGPGSTAVSELLSIPGVCTALFPLWIMLTCP